MEKQDTKKNNISSKFKPKNKKVSISCSMLFFLGDVGV